VSAAARAVALVACDWCGQEFVPPTQRKVYCSQRCVSKASAYRRGHRMSGPEGDNLKGHELAALLTATFRDAPWGDDRPCAGVPADVFFPVRQLVGNRVRNSSEYERRVAQAKALCATCPYRQPCADYAIDQRITDGIFGGLDPDERRRVANQRRRTA
jgi:WhiB family transcriptional regulator, redox-sensing transcriptional regulator